MSQRITDSLAANNMRGIWLMLAGFAAFSIADLFAKLLTADFHPVQIAFTRQSAVVVVALIWIINRGPGIVNSSAPGLQLLRGICATVSATCFIFALNYVPLADAVAVTFVAPFMVAGLGVLLLKEKLSSLRWMAIVAGFVGTLVIIRPGSGAFHPAIFMVVVAAAAFSLRQIISRHLGRRDPTVTTLAYTAMTSFTLLAIPLPLFWTTPWTGQHYLLMIALALLSGVGEFLLIRALETAQAVIVAPTQYSLIIYGTLWGFLVFDELPDWWTWSGIVIVVTSGLYMLYLERREHAAHRS